MFFLTWSHIWSISYFFMFTYFITVFSVMLYLVPIISTGSGVKYKVKINTLFYFISASEITSFLLLPILCMLVLSFLWSSSSLSVWFGHLIFTGFQYKVLYLILGFFILIIFCFASSMYLSSSEIFDFFITKYNFVYWVIMLFFSNSFFTVIFVIEVLSTLVFLLLVTSTFSSNFFYRNINFNSKFYLQSLMPYSFLNSIIFLFWVSLLSSLNLFVFLIFISVNLMTFDWFLIEHLFYYTVHTGSLKDTYIIGFSWFFLIFSIFLKCGLAPVFFWKPTFFKGMTTQSLVFYIVFFYFFLFIYIIYFLLVYMHELYYFYSLVMLVFLMSGFVILLSILCESFYIKTFFAVSSILNSMLVLLATLPNQSVISYIYL